MSAPRVVAVAPDSPAARAGLLVGDEVVSIDGQVPRDVIAYQLLVDEPDIEIDVRRGGLERSVTVAKRPGEPLGAQVDAAIFDAVRTCDNHCEFCFIYQLPKGLRKSLYLKDDDYRLSFLYGNYTTLTRFTELDLERVISERLSPLNVSIHCTDPALRAEMLRNRRGATSLRWLRALLDAGIEVHGQVVVCPGVNGADVLEQTLTDIADRYAELATLCVVPLGVSKFNTEARMRPHTADEVHDVLDVVHRWQELYLELFGRRLVFAADEYYLMAGQPFPPAEAYEGFPMHEDGIGMARAFDEAFHGRVDTPIGVQPGFFAWADGSEGSDYRPASRAGDVMVTIGSRPSRPGATAVLTGPFGAQVLQPLIATLDRADVRIVVVENRFFGGNVGVAGLMVGADLAAALAEQPAGDRYLLPDVCLNQGRFLDGLTPDDLPRPVEIVTTDGVSLRRALDRAEFPR